MVSAFLSSVWFAVLVVVAGAALIAWPVCRLSRRLQVAQHQREAKAIAQAQSALDRWRDRQSRSDPSGSAGG